MTGGWVYRGNLLPQLYGSYLFGDFCSGHLWGAAPRPQGNPAGLQVRELSGAAPLLTTFGQGRDGEIWAGTIGGTLYRLAARGPIASVGGYNPRRCPLLLPPSPPGRRRGQEPALRPARRRHRPPGGRLERRRQVHGRHLEPGHRPLPAQEHSRARPPNISFTLSARGGAIPLAGDWNRDGRDSVGWYDPAVAKFELRNALSAGKPNISFRYGPAGGVWLPVAGDWDGDGDDTVGLYDPATATFHLKNTFTGSRDDLRFPFGPAGNTWIPIAGDWDGDGRDGIGLFDPATSTFRLKNALRSGVADHVFRFGPETGGWLPLAGEW